MNNSEADFFIELNDDKPTEPPPPLISDYIQNRRILPPDSPKPGPIDLNLAPAMMEPMNNMSPYSGVKRTTMMKAVQIFCTTYLAEHPIAYYMDAAPAPVLYCTATLSLLDKWTKRLEPLIDSCGYRHKIVAQVENTKSRKTGDKMLSKEYSGGYLSMASLQSPAGMRSESIKVLIVDEADGAPKKVTTGEGNFLGLLRGRTKAFGSKCKIMELSTPGTMDDSVIYPQFMAGDQRYYNMPCPRCGVMIVFEFNQLRPEFNKYDQLESVYYECQECHDKILHKEKTEMMENGVWVPTAIPKSKDRRSYQINGLYSPIGFTSWIDIYEEYLESEEDPDSKPDFTNLCLGLPYKEDGQRPDITKKNKLRGDYNSGSVPRGVLFLTMAQDVQRGKEVFQAMTEKDLTAEIERLKKKGVNLWKANIPRIELEVYGEGIAYRSWQIEYKIFYGHTTHGPYEGAFERMYEWLEETKLAYRRADGVIFRPRISLMDATDGINQSAVFAFCERMGRNSYPNINTGWLKRKDDPGLDPESAFDRDRYRPKRKGNKDIDHVVISTNYYKKVVYQRIAVERNMNISEQQPPAFCDFPKETADHYFKMLTNEEQLTDGSFRDSGRPHEALDIRGYNLCAAEVWLDHKVIEGRNALEKAGYGKEEVKKFDKKIVLARLEKELEAAARKIRL